MGASEPGKITAFDFSPDEGAKPAGSSVVAWRGSNEKARNIDKDLVLFKITWDNPRPDVRIESIDFLSRNAGAAPFLVAVLTPRESAQPVD